MTSEPRELLRLAAPLAIQHVGFHLMGLVDTVMLGHYSDAALAGSGVGNMLYYAVTAIGIGIIIGMDSVVPRALGAGRTEDARRAVGAGIRLAVLVGLCVTLVLFASPLVLFDTAPDVRHEARAFVYARSLAAVPMLIALSLRTYLAAHSVTRPLIVGILVANMLNAALVYALVYGVFGLPSFGVIGAALATTFVQAVMAAIYWRGVRQIDAGRPRPRSTTADLREIFRYGAPVGGQLFLEVSMFSAATVLAASFGKVPSSAHAIALTISTMTFSFAIGISNATSVRVGHAFGAGDLALARRRGILGLRVGLVAMGTFGLAFLAVPELLLGPFTPDGAVVVSAVPLLLIAAVYQLSDGTQVIAAGALRGLGRTRGTFVANLIGHYGVGLPLMIVLAYPLGLGVRGLWWGLSAGLTGTAVLLVVHFLRSTTRSPQ